MTTRRKYSQEDLTLAVDEIRDGLSFRKAVKKYGIPKTTLVDYCKRGTSVMQKIGPASFWLSVGSPISPDVRPGGGRAKILSQF